MRYIEPGTKVAIETGSVGESVTGIVFAVTLDVRGPATYRCVFWIDGTRFDEWLNPDEISVTDEDES